MGVVRFVGRFSPADGVLGVGGGSGQHGQKRKDGVKVGKENRAEINKLD
jgi:hypothetical protein